MAEHRPSNSHRPLAAIILAAGKGTRMNSDLPKVAHEVAGQAMVRWVVEACREAGAAPIVLVVGHRADVIRNLFADDGDIEFVTQHEQHGTGHAVNCARENLADFEGDVLVLAGDGPLIRAETIETMHAHHLATNAAATLATSVIENPAGYGRIVRDSGAAGRFQAIVEDRDATPEQKKIHEIYPSYACFDARKLFATLSHLKPSKSGEFYITDVPAMLLAQGDRVEVLAAVPPEDVLSINTPQQLAEVHSILQSRVEVKR